MYYINTLLKAVANKNAPVMQWHFVLIIIIIM